MSLTFEPLNEDGTPRLYVGTHREPFGDILKRFRDSGSTIYTSTLFGACYSVEDVKRAYDAGEFDKPLYEAS